MSKLMKESWEVEKFTDGYGVSRPIDGDLENICTINNIENAKEIAQLIAAAPDMVEALNDARNGIQWFIDDNEGGSEEDYEMLKKIDAALAKAGAL